MLVTSRSTAEYHAMFDLAPEDLGSRLKGTASGASPNGTASGASLKGTASGASPMGTVLDCGAGGSSFVADTPGRIVAVDPAYRLGHHDLAARVRAGLRDGDRIIDAHADRFDWGWYGDPTRRTLMRRAAAEVFLTDLRRRPERYLAGALPHLPLAAASFDLVLCSHLLFTWSDHLDAGWHRRAIAELIRVARRQVRIFPLVVQITAEPVAFLDDLRVELHAAGHHTHVRTVPYRFQRGADRMLVIDLHQGMRIP
jgi:SAM-dependent methyltransferase